MTLREHGVKKVLCVHAAGALTMGFPDWYVFYILLVVVTLLDSVRITIER